jgi:hypothetical protein
MFGCASTWDLQSTVSGRCRRSIHIRASQRSIAEAGDELGRNRRPKLHCEVQLVAAHASDVRPQSWSLRNTAAEMRRGSLVRQRAATRSGIGPVRRVGRRYGTFPRRKSPRSHTLFPIGHFPPCGFVPWFSGCCLNGGAPWVHLRLPVRMFVSLKSYNLAFCACVLAAHAHAQEQRAQFVDVKYEVEPPVQGCPSAAEFRSIVAQQLGYDPFSQEAELGVEIRIRRTEAGLEGTIYWSSVDPSKVGKRRFTSRNEDCHEMAATVGFVLAVQIQLMATEKSNASAPHPEDESSTDRGHQPTNALPQKSHSITLSVRSFEVRSVSSKAEWSVMAGLGPSIGFGLAPNAVGQGRLFLALQTGPLGLEAGAEGVLPSTTREPYGGGFRHELFLGTLAACGWQGAFAACGVGKLGEIQVHGTGVDRPASPSGFVAQLGPRLTYSFGLGNHILLLGHIESLYLLTPWTVDLNQLNVWTMPRISAIAGIDVAARFQ